MKRSIFYFLGILLSLLVMVIISIISSYNSLVNLNESRLASWGDVETAYQRRSDLIPNLVATVKGAAAYEKETLTRVIEARAKATSITLKSENLNESAMQRFKEVQEELSSALSRLMVVVEKYPDLKATENFRNLQEQLEGTENRIAFVRENFNKFTMFYNTKLRRFPTKVWVRMFYKEFEVQPYFQAEEGANNVPEVDLLN